MHNSRYSETYKLGHNKFSHISNDEFKSLVQKGGVKKDIKRIDFIVYPSLAQLVEQLTVVVYGLSFVG